MFWGKTYIYVGIIIVLLLVHFRNYFRAVFLALNIPSLPIVPLLGHVLYFQNPKKILWFSSNGPALYGPLIPFWISIVPYFIVHDPNDLQTVLSSNKNSRKNVFYKYLGSFLGEGLITNNGPKWQNHRKLIQPYFHKNLLKVYFDVFRKNSEWFLQKLTNEEVNVVPLVNQLVMDVLHDSILGISDDSDSSSQPSPFRKGQQFLFKRIQKPWLLLHEIFKMTQTFQLELTQKTLLHNYTKQIIEKKRRQPRTLPKTLIEMLMEISKNYPEFDDEDIVNEACTFMLAGQDSVGAALVFSLHFLAKYQSAQGKVLQELDAIFKNSDRSLSYNDLSQMRYLEQCVKESMRLCPSVPFIARKITEELTLGNYVVPAGANIFISPFMTHHSADVFENPQEFDPDRFSRENERKIHPFAYIPFSAGPRKCIAYRFALMEIKTILAQILRNFTLSTSPEHSQLDLLYGLTLKAKGGVWIKFDARAKKST